MTLISMGETVSGTRASRDSRIPGGSDAVSETTDHVIHLNLPSSRHFVYMIDAIISEIVSDMGFDKEESEQINLAVIEAAVNAIKHGNNEDSSKRTRFEFILSQEQLTVVVEDQGTGFNRETVADPLDPSNLLKSSGRGIFLMETCMDSVTYEASGRIVRMVKSKPSAT